VPKLLLGVSGGIAAYKALEFVRLASDAGYAVRVVQTASAQRFVGAASFAALSGAAVLSTEFERDPLRGSFPGDPMPVHDPASHLALVANADIFLIAPASANTLAKLAHGLADNLLSTAALAAQCPLLLAPAMNSRMWEHAATRANVALLRERGVEVLEPGVGRLATVGEHGVGRMEEPAELLAAVQRRLHAVSGDGAGGWSGRRVLVSAGGTREPIDAVRYIGNRSSGRMGFAIAAAAAARGAQVVVIAANVELARDSAVRYVEVSTATQLAAACEAEIDAADVLVMCAAVADFTPTAPLEGKLSRSEHQRLTLELEATPDILGSLAGRRRKGQLLVGFAAEHGPGGLARAREKLAGKQLDLIVYNDISEPGIGFDSGENAVTLVSAAGDLALARADKREVAERLLDALGAALA
jgi:phosphopantothenoylcysteine decarboxylase / phosphopantothenate---cysteine ligase